MLTLLYTAPPPLSEISSFAPQVLHFEGPQLVNNSYLHLYFTVLLKIIGSATVFLLLGALVPWSPITQFVFFIFLGHPLHFNFFSTLLGPILHFGSQVNSTPKVVN